MFPGPPGSAVMTVSKWSRTDRKWKWSYSIMYHNRFTALFPGPPGWAGATRELLDFMVQGKINKGRHIDHPDGRHSIRTKHCQPPPSPFFTGRMPFLPPKQQRQWTTKWNRNCFGLSRRSPGRTVVVLVCHLELRDPVAQRQSHVRQLRSMSRIGYRNSRRHHVRVANSLHLRSDTTELTYS